MPVPEPVEETVRLTPEDPPVNVAVTVLGTVSPPPPEAQVLPVQEMLPVPTRLARVEPPVAVAVQATEVPET